MTNKEASKMALIGERNFTMYPDGSSFTERLLISGEWPKGIRKYFFTLTVKVGIHPETGQDVHIQEMINFDAVNADEAAKLMPGTIKAASEKMVESFKKQSRLPKLAVPGSFMDKSGKNGNSRPYNRF